MKKASLYLIDSGIRTLDKKNIQISFECNEKNKTIEFYSHEVNSSHDHGNNILGIIKDKVSTKIEIISIKILDSDLKAYYFQLIFALQWILKKGHRGIINLSLGVMNESYKEELKLLIKKILEKNIFIICAASKECSLPSILNEVITVADLKLYEDYKNEIKHSSKIDFIVDVEQYRHQNIPSSTSYAAPFVTAKALDIMNTENVKDIEYLRRELCKYFRRWK